MFSSAEISTVGSVTSPSGSLSRKEMYTSGPRQFLSPHPFLSPLCLYPSFSLLLSRPPKSVKISIPLSPSRWYNLNVKTLDRTETPWRWHSLRLLLLLVLLRPLLHSRISSSCSSKTSISNRTTIEAVENCELLIAIWPLSAITSRWRASIQGLSPTLSSRQWAPPTVSTASSSLAAPISGPFLSWFLLKIQCCLLGFPFFLSHFVPSSVDLGD